MHTQAHEVLDALHIAASNGDRDAATFLLCYADWIARRVQARIRDKELLDE